jgi:lipopolysaccharide heptosyltransferase II
VSSRSGNLVVSLQGVGNNVLALPLAAALKQLEPKTPVAMLVANSRAAKVLREHPAVDEVIITTEGLFTCIRTLRKKRFASAYFAYPAGARSHLIAMLGGIPKRIGHVIRGRHDVGLTKKVMEDPLAHDIEQNLVLIATPGEKVDPGQFWPALDFVPTRFEERAREYLVSQGLDPDARFVGIHTGSDGAFVEKRYPPESFAKVAEAIYEKWKMPAIVFDGPAEKGTGVQVVRAAKSPVHALEGWGDLTDAWGLLRHCRLFISNDSGLMNLASACGIPTVGIFGPSLVSRARPYYGEFVKSDWPCSPCYTVSFKSVCPYPTSNCLDNLDPDAVLHAVERLMIK